MKKSQKFALDHYLSSYPEGVDFETILEMIANQDERVVIWSPFENDCTNEINDYISHMANEIETKFYPITESALNIDRDTVKEILDEDLNRECTSNELDKMCEWLESHVTGSICEIISDGIDYSDIERSPHPDDAF